MINLQFLKNVFNNETLMKEKRNQFNKNQILPSTADKMCTFLFSITIHIYKTYNIT